MTLTGHGLAPGASVDVFLAIGKIGESRVSRMGEVYQSDYLGTVTGAADSTFSLSFTFPDHPDADWYQVSTQQGESKSWTGGPIPARCD